MSNPSAIGDALPRIQELLRLELWDLAESSCRELVQVAPENADAWLHLAFAIERCGGLAEAEWALREVVRIDGKRADGWNNLGVVLHTQGRENEAERCARRAVALEGSIAEYWFNFAIILDELQRWEEAAETYRQALTRNPLLASAWNNLGLVEQKCGRLQAARVAYEQCLAIVPDDPDAQFNYANLLSVQGLPQDTTKLSEILTRDDAGTCVAQGNAHLVRQEFVEAETHYRQALRLAPENFAARFNLSTTLLRRRSIGEAEALSRELAAECPNNAEVWAVRSAILQVSARSDEGLIARREAFSLAPNPDRHSRLLMAMHYASDPTPEKLLSAHREWNATYAQHLLPVAPTRIRTHAVPRLGFVSQDLKRHPVASLALVAIEELAKLQCPIVCYSDNGQEDDFSARFRAASERWRNISSQTDEQVAEQIRQDEIDVLFDLAGHTGNRLLVFARNPAPLQITWLGYVGTTGLSAMDYLLADQFHVRPDEEQFYAEKVLRMPNGYACYEPPDNVPDFGPPPAHGGRPFTFGCFNNPAKFSPSILDAWAEIMRRTPGSRLLLKYGGLDDPQVKERLRTEFSRRGVEPERVLVEGWSPHTGLLAAYNRVDLALDTQPYSGGLTTCEALWMGVPVVTFPGKTFAGRHSVSHLSNAGFEQFIAADAAGYIELAVLWAGRLDELAAIRSHMREQVRKSLLCDAPQFARDLLAVLCETRKAGSNVLQPQVLSPIRNIARG